MSAFMVALFLFDSSVLFEAFRKIQVLVVKCCLAYVLFVSKVEMSMPFV